MEHVLGVGGLVCFGEIEAVETSWREGGSHDDGSFSFGMTEFASGRDG